MFKMSVDGFGKKLKATSFDSFKEAEVHSKAS